MGASCCKVSKDKSLASGAQMESFRNVRHSPQWGFRWDNRTHIEDIMDTPSPASQPDIADFNGSEMKRMPTPDRSVPSSDSSPSGQDKASRSSTSNSYHEELSASSKKNTTQPCKPTLPSTLSSSGKTRSQKFAKTSSGKSPLSRNKSSSGSVSSDVTSTSTRSPSASKSRSLPYDTASTSSKSPLFQISRQQSGNSQSHPASFDHDTNHWTFHTFTELVASSQKEKTSFGSEKFNFIRADSRRSNSEASQTSMGPICNICMKPLKERSPHGMQKLYSTNELAAAAVLDCGHVFHADCLEKLTSDVDRYDPECPRCACGDKDLNKLIWNLEYDNKVNKTSKKHVDKLKSRSAKVSFGKPPFLKRHLSEGETSRKKGLFARFRD
ncbi:RING/U-box superfamily protein [Rhynchospora pubera]|uniref:RING/U-box superfamily protein n=1 Tax=Rhynchospora pubera TaxID=906938 RepID=A0AAV8DL24_9POAL|nr:RING/U-box superfamily protein [Rhynchospora pubera]